MVESPSVKVQITDMRRVLITLDDAGVWIEHEELEDDGYGKCEPFPLSPERAIVLTQVIGKFVKRHGVEE